MEIVSVGPFSTASLLWRHARGDYAQTVVCKATFTLLPDASPLADEQEPLNENDHHWNDDPARSLYAPSDLVPFKPRADVLLVGKAFAPREEPLSCIVARLVVGGVDKTIEIHGDRSWTAEGKLHQGPPFNAMYLLYERAAGGAETWNPVGINPGARPDAHGLVRIPNLQPRGLHLTDRSTPIPPVGFGPIAPSWPERARRRGRRAAWPEEDWQRRPLPEDLDVGWFNAAPADQQLEVIRGDERIHLENLHREHARLTTVLAGVRPRAYVETHGAPREIHMICDTLWIDTDRALCTLTFRGVVPLQHPDEAGRILLGVEERGRPIGWADLAREASEVTQERAQPVAVPEISSTQALDPTEEMLAIQRAARGALPFTQPPTPPPPEAPPAPALASAAPPALVSVLPFRPEVPAPRLSVGEAAVLARNAPAQPASSVPPAAPEMLAPAPAPAPAPAKRGPKVGAWVPPGSAAEASPEALPGSVLGASNAAAAAEARPPAPPPAPSRPAAPAAGGDIIELLWMDAEQVARIRKHAAWKKIIAEVKARPREEEVGEAEPREKKQEAKDRRDVLAVLRRGEPAGAGGIAEEIAGAMEDGTFSPPLVLVDGVLSFPFDEKETLKATMALVAPFTAGDKRLKEQSDIIGELLKSPWLESGSAGLEGYTARLREAFAQPARSLPPGYLEAHTERLLLEQRHYQKRTLLGQGWIRGLLTPAGAGAGGGGGMGEAIPAYLPERLAKELPMFQRFRARAVVEARLQLDQFEMHGSALRVVALGRVMALPGRR